MGFRGWERFGGCLGIRRKLGLVFRRGSGLGIEMWRLLVEEENGGVGMLGGGEWRSRKGVSC